MNRGNKKLFPRLGLAALVAVLLISAAIVPASAQLTEPPPAPSAVTINPVGNLLGGVATLSGTFMAPAAASPVFMRVAVTQFHQGGPVSQAFTDLGPIVADGSLQSWAATMAPNLAFRPGQAQVTVKMFGSDGTGLAAAIATVRLEPTPN